MTDGSSLSNKYAYNICNVMLLHINSTVKYLSKVILASLSAVMGTKQLF